MAAATRKDAIVHHRNRGTGARRSLLGLHQPPAAKRLAGSFLFLGLVRRTTTTASKTKCVAVFLDESAAQISARSRLATVRRQSVWIGLVLRGFVADRLVARGADCQRAGARFFRRDDSVDWGRIASTGKNRAGFSAGRRRSHSLLLGSYKEKQQHAVRI